MTSAAAPAARSGVGLTGTASLLRLAARRDRVLVPVSALGLAAFVAMSAQATFALFPDLGSAQASMAPTLANPALVAMYGPISSLGIDSIATFKSVLLGGVFLALLAYVVVRRHTRTEEEAGRLELLGAGVVGRRAALAAGVLLGTFAVLLTVVLTVVWSVGVGLDAAGSIALGVSWLVMGLSWVGVTAVAAQLTSSTRGTAGWSLGALAVAFLVRALGDTAADDSPARFLSWLSPLGWGVKVSAYGANRYWVVVLGLALYSVLVAVAFSLLDRRDLGSGVLPSRAGRDRSTIGTAGALTRRLARGTLIGWGVAYVVLGLVLGSIAGSVETFVDSPQVADMLRAMGGDAGSITDIYFSTELHFAAVGAAALAIALVTRMHTEETTTRAEALLATPVRRVAVGARPRRDRGPRLGCGHARRRRRGRPRPRRRHRRHGRDGRATRRSGACRPCRPCGWSSVSPCCSMARCPATPDWRGPRSSSSSCSASSATCSTCRSGWSTSRPFTHLPALPGGALEWTPLIALAGVAVVAAGAGIAALGRRDIG